MTRDPPHYLRRLKTDTVPKRLAWLYCEGAERKVLGMWADYWKAGALGTTHWTAKRGERKDVLETYEDTAAMWAELDRFATAGRRVVLWTVELGVQLRLSKALVELPRLGWSLERIALEGNSSWASFREGSRTLLCADLRSWAPGWSTHHRKAVYGAQAVRETTLGLLRWISSEQLGPFRPTGSGQSYSALRRRFLPVRPLVHDDIPQLAREREAMWTGRCEAWRHGDQSKGRFVEYDLQNAYCRIAAETDVPLSLVGQLQAPNLARLARAMDRYCVLASVRVRTEVECVPAARAGRILWPVGSFDAVLWGPELQLAIEHSDSVVVRHAWLYRRAPVLAPFATWVLDQLHSGRWKADSIERAVLKHWTRCLVGRLALRYRTWEEFATVKDPELAIVKFYDVETEHMTEMLCAGNKRLLLADMVESPQSLPQITGWIMAECRRRLWLLLARAGLQNVLYTDTDSLIVDRQGAHNLGHGGTEASDFGLTRKGTYRRLVIHGPRNLVLEDERRTAGIPKTAWRTGPTEFHGSIRRSLRESMAAGQLDHVVMTPRRFAMRGVDLRRVHNPDGSTSPYRIEEPDD